MKRSSVVGVVLFVLVYGSALNADIYVWVDEAGVKNFTNFSPPEGAEIFLKDSGISQTIPADAPPKTDQIQQPKPDSSSEVSRLREELEAVKKLLAETLAASAAAKKDQTSDPEVSDEDAYQSSGDSDTPVEQKQSYTIVHKYRYPYYGYGPRGFDHDRYSGKKYRYYRYSYKKRHHADYQKDNAHGRGHKKHQWTKSNKHKQDIQPNLKQRIKSRHRHAEGWNRHGSLGSRFRMPNNHRR